METTIIVEKSVPFKKFYLVPLADFHIKAKGCDLDIIKAYVDWIKNNENAYTVFNGDLLNCATKDSMPELFEDLISVDDSYDILRDIVMPIRNKVLLITRGGHEEAIYRKVGVDMMARLANDLDVPYRPDGGMVEIKVDTKEKESKCSFFVYAVHGWGAARTIGAKAKKTEDLALAVDADIYIVSHDHTQVVHRLNYLVPSSRRNKYGAKRLIPHRKILVNTGAFLRYEGYVSRKGYLPQDLGTPRILCEVKHEHSGVHYKDLHASI